MRLLVTLILLFCAQAKRAQDAMNATEFEALTKGKTFHFRQDGNVYGAESYLNNRHVRWSFFDGTCLFGHWFVKEGYICFDYGADLELQCWTFRKTNEGFRAEFYQKSGQNDIYEAYPVNEPLQCLGPKIGV